VNITQVLVERVIMKTFVSVIPTHQ